MKFILFPIALAELLFFLCATAPMPDSDNSQDCLSSPMTVQHQFRFGPRIKHWQRAVELPATGRFAEESHYVTTEDEFSMDRLFANTVEENIEVHLERSLALYRQYDSTATFEQLYDKDNRNQWTPAEMGKIGQGSIGDRQVEALAPAEELWLLTMMWQRNFKPDVGTKFLVEANGKQVVVVAGFETGPGDQRYLGGLTPEVHHWLGTSHNSGIQIYYLANQDLPAGPISCSSTDAH